MLILEKPFSDEEFFEVLTLQDIKNSPPNSTLVFNYCDSSLELYSFCKKNSIPFAVRVNSVKEMIFSANLGAKYIFCDTIKNAKIFQKIADDYLLDAKVVLLTENFDIIEEAAINTIDAIKLKGKR